LGRVFGRLEIIDAIKLCYDRSPEFIAEYLEENFKLIPSEVVDKAVVEEAPTSRATGAGATSDDLRSVDHEEDTKVEGSQEPTVETTDVSDEVVVENDQEEPVDDEVATPRRRNVRPPKPSLIERFTKAKGYSKDGDERFFRPDGSFIARANGMRFPWELRSASGELLQCYWLKDHCLQKEPLDLAAELWNLCDQSPQKYSLILSDESGDPVEISGNRLQEMRDRGEISFHAATFRLVYETK